MGNGVRQRLLRVAAVVVDLKQDGEVHEDLQQPAGPELHGGLGEHEVDGLKGVAAGPHQHHLNAGGEERQEGRLGNTHLCIKSSHVREEFFMVIQPESILNPLSPGSDAL